MNLILKEKIELTRFIYKEKIVEQASRTIKFKLTLPESLKGDELNNITVDIISITTLLFFLI